MTALDQFRTIGVDFVSVTESIDTTTSAGRFV
jgi:DNA invertase Pin-like site-specific DNA recombinase